LIEDQDGLNQDELHNLINENDDEVIENSEEKK
jgi:hypothetical protein